MCGIAGWVAPFGDLSGQGPTVAAMGARVACRGPDAEGLSAERHAILAHRRLVVIDPVGGRQPMRALNAARPPRYARLRRQWTVIKGGRRHEPAWRTKASGRPGRRRNAGY